MKQMNFKYCFVILSTITSLMAEEPPQQQQPIIIVQQQQEFDSTPLVLQNFGGMLSSFLNILVKPNDPEHVVGCVSDMAQGMVNIVTVGMKRSPAEHHKLYQEFYETLTRFFATEEGQSYLRDLKISMVQHTSSLDCA